MDGIRLNDFESLEACGANNQKIVEEITRAFAHQIYVDGFFNGDTHPGTPLSLSLSLNYCSSVCLPTV
jgi:aarF domain-containing kinase